MTKCKSRARGPKLGKHSIVSPKMNYCPQQTYILFCCLTEVSYVNTQFEKL